MLKTYKLNAGNILLVNHSSQLSYKASNSESITVILAQKQSGKKVAIISFQLHGVEVPNLQVLELEGGSKRSELLDS